VTTHHGRAYELTLDKATISSDGTKIAIGEVETDSTANSSCRPHCPYPEEVARENVIKEDGSGLHTVATESTNANELQCGPGSIGFPQWFSADNSTLLLEIQCPDIGVNLASTAGTIKKEQLL
jgi:hypothetical protein